MVTYVYLSAELTSTLGTYLPGVVQLEFTDIAFGYNLGTCVGPITLGECESLCSSTPGCLGLSFGCTGASCKQSTASTCCLKSELGTSDIQQNYEVSVVVNPYCKTKQVPIIGWDFNGNDITSVSATYDQCIQLCLATTGCGMVTVDMSNGLNGSSVQHCSLKTITNLGWSFNSTFQSYLLPRSTSGGTNAMNECLPCPQGVCPSFIVHLG